MESDSQECSVQIQQAFTKLGFSELTPIQKLAVPRLMAGANLFALAPTGSGKTLAYAVPLLQRLDLTLRATQILVLVPTRELGNQVAQVFQQAMGEEGLVRRFFGGVKIDTQIVEAQKSPHVVIATPGRLWDLLNRKVLNLTKLQALVLDEVDQLVGLGFADQVAKIFPFLPSTRQNAFFSATFSEKIETLKTLSQSTFEVLKLDDVASHDKAHLDSKPSIKQLCLMVDGSQKQVDLYEILASDHFESGIVFCKTRERVSEVTDFLREKGIAAEELSGDLGQVERTSVMRRFKAKGFRFLIATNVAARGLDVDDLSVVINLDLPDTQEDYTHRIGRTGRAGESGFSVTICTEREYSYLKEKFFDIAGSIKQLRSVKELDMIKPKLEKKTMPAHALNFQKIHINRGKSEKIRPGDIVGFLTACLGLEKDEVGSIYIFDHFSIVDVAYPQVKKVLAGFQTNKIKNLTAKASLSQNDSDVR